MKNRILEAKEKKETMILGFFEKSDEMVGEIKMEQKSRSKSTVNTQLWSNCLGVEKDKKGYWTGGLEMDSPLTIDYVIENQEHWYDSTQNIESLKKAKKLYDKGEITGKEFLKTKTLKQKKITSLGRVPKDQQKLEKKEYDDVIEWEKRAILENGNNKETLQKLNEMMEKLAEARFKNEETSTKFWKFTQLELSADDSGILK